MNNLLNLVSLSKALDKLGISSGGGGSTNAIVSVAYDEITKVTTYTKGDNTTITINQKDLEEIQSVNTFADLPTDIAGNIRKIIIVRTTTGVIGFRKQQGIYSSNGVAWVNVGVNLSAILTYYNNSNSSLTSTNVNDAIDSLDSIKMNKAIYDPTNIGGSAFSQDNMISGTSNKNYLAQDKVKVDLITINTSEIILNKPILKIGFNQDGNSIVFRDYGNNKIGLGHSPSRFNFNIATSVDRFVFSVGGINGAGNEIATIKGNGDVEITGAIKISNTNSSTNGVIRYSSNGVFEGFSNSKWNVLNNIWVNEVQNNLTFTYIDSRAIIGKNQQSSLLVNGNITARSGEPLPNGVGNAGFSFTGDPDSGLYNTQDGACEIRCNSDVKLWITGANGGRVGINTVNPTSALHVEGFRQFSGDAAAKAGGLTYGAIYQTGEILKAVLP